MRHKKIKNEWKILATIFVLVCIIIGALYAKSYADRVRADAKALAAIQAPPVLPAKPMAAPYPPFPPGVPIPGVGSTVQEISGVPVLMYHHIGDVPANADPVRRDLTVSTANFTAQMDYLKQQGYQTITTTQLYKATQGSFKLPRKPVIVTLDDGYLDAFQNAVPVFLKDGMRGVFAIITAYPDHYSGYADWQQIADAKAQGMEIIPHTQHHIDLKNKKYSYADKEGELLGSISDIQTHLSTKPVAFIYPYGNYDQDSMDILAQGGIKFAFTVKPGLFSTGDVWLAEPRVRVHGSEDLVKFEENLQHPMARSGSVQVAHATTVPAVPSLLPIQK